MNLLICKSLLALGLASTATLTALAIRSRLTNHAKVYEDSDDPILFI